MMKHYRVGNPREVPSYIHVLRFKEPDYMEGEILIHGAEVFMYEDDIVLPPSCMKADELQGWINRGFLVEANCG